MLLGRNKGSDLLACRALYFFRCANTQPVLSSELDAFRVIVGNFKSFGAIWGDPPPPNREIARIVNRRNYLVTQKNP